MELDDEEEVLTGRPATTEELRRAYLPYRCCTWEEFLAWANTGGRKGIGNKYEHIQQKFCEDCTDAFKASESEEGRCWRTSSVLSQ